MIFVGDIAIPYRNAVSLLNFPDTLKNKSWIGNLEGAVIQDPEKLQKESIVFNEKEGVRYLLEELNFSGLTLANNHIFDTGSLMETCDFLKSKKIPYCGIGKTLEEARNPIVLEEAGNKIIILNFGWEVIQCEVTNGHYTGVNALTRKNVLRTVEKTILENPDAKVIPFMHWSYELEAEPQPFERELAKKLIDMGVAGVIGCHPHRIGGFELYKNKPIVYSLGNWMFKQNYFFNGKLKFPDFCNQELALEWDFKTDEIKFHFFSFDRDASNLSYTHTEGILSKTMSSNTPFRGFSNHEYREWYKKNHYHKNKGLPIYYWEDGELVVKLKNKINKFRDVLLQIVLKLK
jgi:poly-gamma-glutamate synthesis protein (capsule biosynthesis protein)